MILRIFLFIGLLTALLAGGVILLSQLASPQFVVAQLQEAVQRATGRTLTVEGRPALSLWPRIAITLPDVRLSNPPGMARGDFIKAGEIALAVEAWPLLQRRLVVRRILLREPEITLLVDGKGRANWRFDTAATGDASGKAGARKDGAGNAMAETGSSLLREIRLSPVIISNGVLLIDDRRAGQRHLITGIDMKVALPSPQSPLKLDGAANWRGQRLRLTLFVRRPAALATQGSPVELLASSPRVEAAYRGLVRLAGVPELAGRIEASGKSLRALLRWVGAELPQEGHGLKNFSLRAALRARGGVISLKKIDLSLDGSRARGEARLDTRGTPLRITAALGVDRLITDTYLGPSTAATNKQGKDDKGATGGWSDAPLNIALPAGIVADVRIRLNELRHRRLKMGPGTARFRLSPGGLRADLANMAFYDGQISGQLAMKEGKGGPALTLNAKLARVQARPFLVDFARFERLSGRLQADVKLATRGRSMLELVGRLKGDAALTFRDGKVHGVDLVKILTLVQRAIVSGWQMKKDESTEFVELAADFAIADGIATTKNLRMLGPLVQVSGAGEVDILRQKLDMRVDARLVKRKAADQLKDIAALPVPIVVKGRWDAPKIYPDIKGILKDPKAAYGKLQQLMRAAGGRKAAEKIDRARRKVKEALKEKVQKKLDGKVGKQLEKVLGKEEAGKITGEVKDQAKELLKGLFR